MSDTDSVYDLTLIANKPASAQFLLNSLKQAAIDIGLYVKSDF